MDIALLPVVGLVFIGAVAGVLSGLFGIGGGIIIVPALAWWLERQGISSDLVMQCAIGTSLATIIFTALSSIRAHHARRAIRWRVFWQMTPGVLVGGLLGSLVAHALTSQMLRMLFGAFLLLVAFQLAWRTAAPALRQLPRFPGVFACGGVIGGFSSLFGIGGGTLSVPFLTWCSLPVVQAIATAGAVGLPIALAGTAGYIAAGWGTTGLPPWSLGYVALVPLLALAPASVLSAPLGARLAHRAPQLVLRRLFALLLVMVALRLLFGG